MTVKELFVAIGNLSLKKIALFVAIVAIALAVLLVGIVGCSDYSRKATEKKLSEQYDFSAQRGALIKKDTAINLGLNIYDEKRPKIGKKGAHKEAIRKTGEYILQTMEEEIFEPGVGFKRNSAYSEVRDEYVTNPFYNQR